jgi:predicted deacylase
MGSKKKQRINVGELVFGKAEIVVYRIEGGSKGPRVGLVGMAHGTEYIGAKVIDRLYDQLNPDELKGSVVAIPIANPFATAGKNSYTPSGFGKPFSNVSLNSQYPGNIEGNLSEQLAAKIFGILEDVDYLVDIHSGTIVGRIHPQARIRTDNEIKGAVVEESRKLALNSGLETIVETESSAITKDTKGLLTTQASLHGIPAVTIELFGGHVTDKEVEFGLNAVCNILRGLGSLDGRSSKADQQTYTQLTKIYSPQAGIIDFEKELGEQMKGGEVYARIKDLLSGETSELVAPQDGILGFRLSFAVLNKGDYLGEFLGK